MDWSLKYFPEYWGGKKLAYPHVPKEHPKFAQSIVVGNVVFLSGCTGNQDGKPAPGRVEDQVNLALDKARHALKTAGSRMENIVKTFFLITSLGDYGRVRKTETEYYERHAPQLITTPPAATLMVVPALARPEFLLEYEAIAALDRRMPDWAVTYYPEFWGGKELAYPHVPKEHAKFARSQSIGNLVIVSGCQALDHDTVKVETADFVAQSRIVLDKIKIAIEETGGSLETIAKTNVFIKDVALVQTYRDVERAFFEQYAPALTANPPASTVFVMTELPRPEFLIEVEAFGVANASARDWETRYQSGTLEAAESVTAGNLVFLSGCDGADEAGAIPISVEREMLIAFDKVSRALSHAGSSMNKIIKTTMMLRHIADYPKMRAAELDFYQKHASHLVECPPASTFMQVPAINVRGARFQIDVTAVV